MNKLHAIFATITVLISAQAFAVGNAQQGQAKSATCVGCHGVDGNAIVPTFPKLAGQNPGYLLKQLKDFKSGARVDAVMMGIVAPLSEADMADIAAYYAAQKVAPGTPKPDADIALGESIYRGGKKSTGVTACAACHGPDGKGIPSAGFPALASQHAAYTIKQLKDFRQDSINVQTGNDKPSRANDYEGVMINFTKSLTNAEIEAVSEYIAGLH